MENSFETILINISNKSSIVENVFIGVDYCLKECETYMSLFKEYRDVFTWSYDEMPGIDPWIVEHEIKTYPNVKPV